MKSLQARKLIHRAGQSVPVADLDCRGVGVKEGYRSQSPNSLLATAVGVKQRTDFGSGTALGFRWVASPSARQVWPLEFAVLETDRCQSR